MNDHALDPDRTPPWQTAAATPADSTPLDTGRGIGRYRLERVLGEGTYGRVYLAQHEVMGRRVAVKVLHRRHGSSSHEIRAFLNEALVLADADHPGIVPIYDAGWTEDGLYYIVSRYVEGGDLGAVLTRGRLEVRESAGIALAVAEALHYAHGRGLVHRDIKPANILVDLAGRPLVADFGVALRDKDFGRGARLAGTPAYMSPEQARGEGHRVDGRSDVFSLGVVLYEMLTGRRPFRGANSRELAEQIMTGAPPSPRRIDAGIPDALERICLKALEKRASDRYATAEDMARDLRDHLQAETGAGWLPGATLPAHPTPDPPILPSTREVNLTSTMSAPSGSAPHPPTIRPRGLRPFGAEDADFFLDLLPGPREGDGLPESVGFWRSRIEGLEGYESFRVGLIFGPCGCGKTSLVRAGLLPRLSRRIVSISIEATSDDTESVLLGQLRGRCPGLPRGFSLATSFIAARKGRVLPPGSRLLVIIDQFERWLLADRSRDEKGLVAALHQCDGEHVQALLVVRDDCWLGASRLMREVDNKIVEGGNAWAVDPWDPRHARGVLASFGRAQGSLPEGPVSPSDDQEKFLNLAIAALSRQGQVLPIRLALLAELVKGRPWTPATWEVLGDLRQVESSFLEWCFDADDAPVARRTHRMAACGVLQALAPGPGGEPQSRSRSYGELLAASGYVSRPHDFDSLLHILTHELGVISLDDDAEGRDGLAGGPTDRGDRSYRLTHDYLGTPLSHWLARDGRAFRRDALGPHPLPPISADPAPSPAGPIDINTATEEELRGLPGVSLAIARQIIAGRPCRSPDELLRIKGITAKKLEGIRPLIRMN